jgi:hypothetical protein
MAQAKPRQKPLPGEPRKRRGATKLHPLMVQKMWKPGQTGNPGGVTGEYGEAMRLARSRAPRGVMRLIELAELDELDATGSLKPLSAKHDPRVVTVAVTNLLDRAFGRPKEYDPAKDPANNPRPAFDPRAYSDEELERIEGVLRLLMEPRRVVED